MALPHFDDTDSKRSGLGPDTTPLLSTYHEINIDDRGDHKNATGADHKIVGEFEFKRPINRKDKVAEKDSPEFQQITFLRNLRKKIVNEIKSLKLKKSKRKRLIQGLMGLVMLGTAGYLIYNGRKYYASLDDLSIEASQLRNQTQLLVNFRDQTLAPLLAKLSDILHVQDNWWAGCARPDFYREGNCWSYMCLGDKCDLSPFRITQLTPGCGVADMSMDKFVSQLPCEYSAIFGDYCRVLMPHYVNFCNTTANIAATNSLINSNWVDINKIMNDPDDIYFEAMGGILGYYFVTLGLGEVTPFLVILLLIMSNKFSDWLLTSGRCALRDSEEIASEEEYGLAGMELVKPKSLTTLERARDELNEKLRPADTRLALFKAKRDENCHAHRLFETKNDDNPESLNMGEPQLAREIFEMLGVENLRRANL